MRKQSFTFPLISLFGGIALGFWGAQNVSRSATEDEEVIASTNDVAKATHIASAGDDEIIKSLRSRIRELEKKLEKDEEVLPPNDAEAPVAEDSTQRTSQKHLSHRERMAEWKKKNPEQYERMRESRLKFLEQRAERAQEKIDFLASVDISSLGTAAKEAQDDLQSLLATREELEEKTMDDEMSDEDRNLLFRSMHETDRAINSRCEEVRANLLRKTAINLGVSDNTINEMIETVDQIYDITDPTINFWRPRRRRAR